MKRIVIGIICGVAVLLWAACNREEVLVRPADDSLTDKVILNISSGRGVKSRATVADNGAETAIQHLDVLIFGEDGAYKHHERVAVNREGDGKIALAVKRSGFSVTDKYLVYLLANSTIGVDVLQGKSLTEIKTLAQEDERVHMTGNTEMEGAPEYFLMDGCAFATGGTEPQTPAAVALNDGVEANNTELSVVLRRAAAKIVVTIRQGEKVTFDRTHGNEGYYPMNMAYSTSLLGEVENTGAKLRTPDKTAGAYFVWGEGVITVTAYVYSHDWKDASLDRETCLVVNIPLKENEGEQKVYPNSYYKIPVSELKRLDRNTYYGVDVTVNAPGAANMNKPLPVEDISYTVMDWIPQEINIGGEMERPKYLTVNTDSVEMVNITDDKTTLHFASSADVTVEVGDVYFIDKFGQRQTVYNHGVTATPTGDLTGNVEVHSPVPTNNTVRYIELTVWNREDNLSHKVTVAQYPLEYITNIQSWYSYRDDFKTGNNPPTTYEKGYDPYYVTASDYNERTQTWSYSRSYPSGIFGGFSSAGFWHSKVARPRSSDGMSDIYYYYYGRNYRLQEESAESGGNARMYHVRLTSSSGEYTVGAPRMTSDGFTDAGKDNAKLVSPSFMIASRLGFIMSGTLKSKEMAERHCEKYVEVYKDPETGEKVVLDDWRLPTEAEIKIIIKFQGQEGDSADAIDFLLNADAYYSASGPVSTKANGSVADPSVRCIRDAYVKKTMSK